MNDRHSAIYGCDLFMAQTFGFVLHQTQKKLQIVAQQHSARMFAHGNEYNQ